jgi:hypothetical protein
MPPLGTNSPAISTAYNHQTASNYIEMLQKMSFEAVIELTLVPK